MKKTFALYIRKFLAVASVFPENYSAVNKFGTILVWDHYTILTTRFQTYEEAQNKIDDDKDQEPLAQGLRRLLKLSKIMKQKRIDNGALQLASSEVR